MSLISRRRMMMQQQGNKDDWTIVTEEFTIGTTAGRWKMAPQLLTIGGDWTEMELTVEEISGDMTELTGKRLNYDSGLAEYSPGNVTYAISSPISYSAVKDGESIIITRLAGIYSPDITGYNPGTTIPITISSDNSSRYLGLWIHWGAPTNELKVRGTIKYK